MPKGKRPESKPATNAPPSGGNDGKPNAGAPLDFGAWKAPAGTSGAPKTGAPAVSTEAQTQREKRPRASWDQLSGIDGLRLVDVFEDSDETYGDYVGSTVRLPRRDDAHPSVDVLVLTGADTRAGKWLTHKSSEGTFDGLGGDDGATLGIRVRVKKSPLHPDGRPMVLLALTEG